MKKLKQTFWPTEIKRVCPFYSLTAFLLVLCCCAPKKSPLPFPKKKMSVLQR